MKIQGALVVPFLAKGTIAGNHSKVKENVICGAECSSIPMLYNNLREAMAAGLAEK
jgi:hypothetical protein